jgi:hypothetical protein
VIFVPKFVWKLKRTEENGITGKLKGAEFGGVYRILYIVMIVAAS